VLTGCIALPASSEQAREVTRESAATDLAGLYNHQRPLVRPVVVLSGYRTLGIHAAALVVTLRKATSGKDEDFLFLSYPLETDLDHLADYVVRQVDKKWPSADDRQTVPVDVVGVSMGGVLARWAALPPDQRRRDVTDAAAPGAKRLNIVRLFTFSSPHQGALMSEALPIDPAARDMRRGSAFLDALDEGRSAHPYELVCYAQTGDNIVGATRTAPPGEDPIWTDGTVLFSHFSVVENPIFLADAAKRLRGETPLVTPHGPPPHD
jgi:pimeloyl-ACP methyl ester carboxylesterase